MKHISVVQNYKFLKFVKSLFVLFNLNLKHDIHPFHTTQHASKLHEIKYTLEKQLKTSLHICTAFYVRANPSSETATKIRVNRIIRSNYIYDRMPSLCVLKYT